MAGPPAHLSETAPATVRQGIADLEQSGARRFAPVRFRFIETMARRAREQKPPVRAILEEKALVALADYRTDFLTAQGHAATIVTRILERFPASAERVRSLFAGADFSAVERLHARLNRQGGPKAGTEEASPLGSLTEEINQRALAAGDSVRSGPAGEPHSVRQFRELLVKLDSEKLVTRAIKEGPAAPGPLNAQALVIRTLAALRDLSPDYLNRFVCYADTLLWLEQAGEKGKPARLKPGRSKRDTR